MKVALLSGALKNAGDYLIVDRSKKIIHNIYPDSTIEEYIRTDSLEECIDRFNSNDIAVCSGGPGYIGAFYPHGMPLVSDLSKIKIPIFIMGMGWDGVTTSPQSVYTYGFSEQMKSFLERVQSDTHILGCRDWYSVNVLRNAGIQSGYMTGCPAWYNLDFIDQIKLSQEKKSLSNIKKICISDPRKLINLLQMEKLTEYLKNNFKAAKLIAVFHRGIQSDMYTPDEYVKYQKQFIQKFEAMGVEVMDISYGTEGMSVYDDCDLHIGFRVHAHIYNLSRRNISVLIEEDGRGGGVNDCLGLARIKSYDDSVKETNNLNQYMMYQIEDELCNLIDHDFCRIENAYSEMNRYYKNMHRHVSSMKDFI